MTTFKVGDLVEHVDDDPGFIMEILNIMEHESSAIVRIPSGKMLVFDTKFLRRAGAQHQNTTDTVNHPAHYTAYPIEVIQLTEHLNFCRGSAVKYLARAGLKNPDKEIEDLEKAAWYIQRELNRLKDNK